MSDQPRVTRGVPEGGQWSARSHAEADVDLSGVPKVADVASQRLAELAELGYVPAVALRTDLSPQSAARRGDWWDDHFASAEYGHDRGGYRQMPDDFTPGRTGGQALSGHRRTHRMCYSGSGVSVRMPSATSVRRFSAEQPGTFDVPVTAEIGGASVQGWVRVTRTGDRFHTSALGFGAGAEPHVAEAVSAVLEARRPSMALRECGDLLERRRARLEAAGTPLQPVSSSWIDSVGYEDDSDTMVVTTKRGDTYGYDVGRSTFDTIVESSSPGRAYNELVKGRTDRKQVSRCQACARFTTAGAPHACAASHRARTTGAERANEQARNRAAWALAAAVPRQAPTSPPPAPVVPIGDGTHVRPADEVRIDLAARLRALGRRPVLDTAGTGTSGLYGRRGWTTDAAKPLAAFTSSTYVPSEYATIGGQPDVFAFANGDSGVVHFDGADAAAAAQLLPKMPPPARQAGHNDGPPAERVLEAVAANPGRFEFMGHIVGPDRTDERVAVDGVRIYGGPAADTPDARAQVLAQARDVFGATVAPSECALEDSPWRPGEKTWRLSWD
jgi:hypothetical protein